MACEDSQAGRYKGVERVSRLAAHREKRLKGTMLYRLRTLMIVLALGPMVLSFGYREFRRYQFRQSVAALKAQLSTDFWPIQSEQEFLRVYSEIGPVRCDDPGEE
jgi:hypothetical protein